VVTEPGPLRLLLTADETAAALGVSPRTLAKLTADHAIPVCRLGPRTLRYPLDALRAWVGAQTIAPAATAAPAVFPQGLLAVAEQQGCRV